MLITTPQQLKEEFARVIGEEAMNNFARNYESADNPKDSDTATLDQYFEYMFESGLLSSIVGSAFNWYNSPQGREYWEKVDETWCNRRYVYSVVSRKSPKEAGWQEYKPGPAPATPQNAIIINGVVYEYVDNPELRLTCRDCALLGQCDTMEKELRADSEFHFFCEYLYGKDNDGVFVRRN